MLRRVPWRFGGHGVSCFFLFLLCLCGPAPARAQSPGSSHPAIIIPQISAPQGAAQEQTAPTRAAATDSEQSYRIGPGDLLDIRVFNRPELARKSRVDNLGRISMPLIGEFTAACLSERQLAQVIAEKYKKYLRDPQVDVFIEEYNSQPVSIMGEVVKPGRFPLTRRVRLLDVLASAGGASAKAGQTIYIFHSNEQNPCSLGEGKEAVNAAPALLTSIKLNDLQTGRPEANVYVSPGDIIHLPEAEQIFVTGSVPRPGPFLLQGKTTLTEAIGMAGGPTAEATKKRISLSRLDPATGARVETIYNLEEIKARRAEDVVLQANDIIEVPNSTGGSLKRGIFAALAQSAGLLPIYSIIR
jgi:polysaccharide export outer membrane protein